MNKDKNQIKSEVRYDFVDITKAIAIFFVVLGHLVDSDTSTKMYIYGFHMPLFFIASGIVNKERESYNFSYIKEFVIKKVSVIYVPYLIWGMIYSKFSFKNVLYILYGTRETLIKADSLTSLWFLPVMLLALIMVEAVNILKAKLKLNRYLAVCSGIIIFATAGLIIPHYEKYGYPFGLDVAFNAAAFILIGKLIMCLFSSSKLPEKLFTVCGAVVGGALYLFTINLNTPETGYVLMANAVYGNGLLFYVTSLSASFFFVCISKLIEKFRFKKNIITYIGKNTLGIFIVHKPFVELMRRVLLKAGIDYNFPPSAVAASFVTLVIVLIPVYLIKKYFPYLFGKYRSER